MRSLLLLLLAACCWPLANSAQELFRHSIPLTESGAPVRVNDMATDDLGALWLGTENGLYRYNGHTVTEEPPASARRPVSAVAVYRNALFVGFRDGNVMAIRGGKARRIFGTASSSSITSLLPTPLGLLVATGGEGIALLRPGAPAARFTVRHGLADDYVYTLALDTPRGAAPRVLAGTDRGITVITLARDSLKVATLTTRNTPGLLDDIVRVIRPVGAIGGNFFVGTQAGGASRLWWNTDGWPAAKWAMQHRSEGEPGTQVNDVLPLDILSTAEARADGLFIPLSAPSEHGLRGAYSQPGRAVHRILQDERVGGLWLATDDGLEHLSYASIHRTPMHRGYQLSSISAIAHQYDVVWYAQDRALFSRDEKDRIRRRYTAPETITSLCADWMGRLWIGTLGGGLLCMDKRGRVHAMSSVEALRGGHILHITSVWDTLFVSSLSGVEELVVDERPGSIRVRSIRHHGRAEGTGSDYVYALMNHFWRGEIWMATDGAGIVVWDGKKYRRFDSTNGFAPRVVYALTQSPINGEVWAGTLDGGLLRWDGKRWTTFRKEQGLPGNTVFAVEALDDGSVVAVTDGGAAQWLPASREFRHLDARAGVPVDSFSSALNLIAKARDGSAVIPVSNGLLWVEAALFSRFSLPDYRPRIALHTLELFGEPLRQRRNRFAPDENSIGFRWDGIHPAEAHRLRYRYRLRGYGQGWVETGDEAISFPRLPAGRYLFEVEAALGADFSHSARASYAFKIATPLWKRWWTWALLAAGFAGTAYLLLQRRDRARQRLAALQQARLRAEYEGLKSQVNPHFLFNSLNTLVGLIEEDPAAAARYTEQLSDLYRDTLSFRSRDVVTLAEEWEVLQKYLYIQQSRFGEALRVETRFVDNALQKAKVVPLALQLLVENAIKHNEVSRAHPLTILISATEDAVTVSNILQPKTSREKGAGIGLENIRNRYALLTSRPVSASKSGGHFTVTLPLLTSKDVR